MHPILIDFGFFKLPFYGLLLATAVAVSLWNLKRRADRFGLDSNRLLDLCLWLVIWALVGSKLLFVIVEGRRYMTDPRQLLDLIHVGGVFLGGFIAAVLAAFILLRRYRLPLLPTMDVIAPSLALGQAIGRLGCLMAGCCWGRECRLPWAITYTDPFAHSNLGTPLGIPLHPFPIYASLFTFSVFLGLAALYRRKPRPGRVFATYLVVYACGRFLLELTRGDEARGFVLDGALSTSQLIALLMLAAGVALHLWVSRRRNT